MAVESQPLGTQYGRVELVPFKQNWLILFASERDRIKAAFPEVVCVEHVGSTAIEGVHAKPTLDIMAGFENLHEADTYLDRLSALGYEFRPSHPVPDRLHFARVKGNLRTHNLSVTKFRSRFWVDHLRFRDYLRANPETASAYVGLKRRLAKDFPDDPVQYTNGKNAFIEQVLKFSRKSKPD